MHNHCPEGGLLIGMQDWLPASPHEYNWGTFDPRIGCNRLVCGACGHEVRHLAGVEITDHGTMDPAALYAAADWTSLPQVRPAPTLEGRLYACPCQYRMQFGSTELDPPLPAPEREFISAWRCAGHPRFTLPGEIAGVSLDGQTDYEACTREALLGTLAAQPARIARIPGYLALRMYILLRDAGLGTRVGHAVAACLTDPAPVARRGALEFFYEQPDAPGAERVAQVAARHRDLFSGHADPTDGRYDLEEHLLRVLERRIAAERSGGPDPDALDIVRDEVRAGTGRTSLVRALARVDAGWVRDHAADITAADPRLLKSLVYALRELPASDIATALIAVRARGSVADDALRQAMSKAFRDPALRDDLSRHVFGPRPA